MKIDLVKLLYGLQNKGLSVWVNDNEKLIIDGPKEVINNLDKESIENIKANKSQIISILKSNGINSSQNIPCIYKNSDRDIFPLSSSQKNMWFLYKLRHENGTENNMPFYFKFVGKLDEGIFEQAVSTIVERHTTLRTVIIDTEDGAFQKVLPENIQGLEIIEADNENIDDILFKESTYQFDLEKGDLTRFKLFKLSAEEYIFCITQHHIIGDAWSVGVFLSELSIIYNSMINNTQPNLNKIKIGFGDYAVWQEEYLRSESMNTQLEFWGKELKGYIKPSMPLDMKRPDVQNFNGDFTIVNLGNEIIDKVNNYIKETSGSKFIFFSTVYNILMHKITRQNDIISGTVIANRNNNELKNMMGYLANLLPLRILVEGNESFSGLYSKVKEKMFEIFNNQNVPFNVLVSKFSHRTNAESIPIIQNVFALQNANDKLIFKLKDIDVENVEIDYKTSHFDLFIQLFEKNDGMNILLEFNSDIYNKKTVEQIGCSYKQLVKNILNNPDSLISDLSIVDEEKSKYGIIEQSDCQKLTSVIKSIIFSCNLKNISDAAVAVKEDIKGNKKLVAYLALDNLSLVKRIHFALQNELPQSLVPDIYIPVSAIPYNSNGTADVEQLNLIPHVSEEIIYEIENRINKISGVEKSVVLLSENSPKIKKVDLPDSIFGEHRKKKQAVQDEHETNASKNMALICGGELEKSDKQPENLVMLLENATHDHPETEMIFINEKNEIESIKFQDLFNESERLLSGLRQKNLNKGDKVILQVDDVRYFLTAFWALALGGYVPVLLSMPKEFDKEHADIKKLYNIWALTDNPPILTLNAYGNNFEDLGYKTFTIEAIMDKIADCNHSYPDKNDLLLMAFTSGSTGMPKGVCLRHKNLIAAVLGLQQRHKFSNSDRFMCWMPIEHVASIDFLLLLPSYLGCTQIYSSINSILKDPLVILDYINDYKPSVCWVMNFMVNLILKEIKAGVNKNWDLSSMKFIINGAETVDPAATKEFMHVLEKYGLDNNSMKPGWGMTETSGYSIMSERFNPYAITVKDKFAELGKPSPGYDIRIVDETGNLVEEGERGALEIRGNGVTSGYYKNEELNKEIFSDGGWFKTGDVAIIENDSMRMVGRDKDELVINGKNYSSLEIESAVEEIEGVNPSYTIVVAAESKLNPEDQVVVFFSPLDEDYDSTKQLIKKIKAHIVKNIGIDIYYFIPLNKSEIPKTSLGKLQRKKLKLRFLNGDFKDILNKFKYDFNQFESSLPGYFFSSKWNKKEITVDEYISKHKRCLIFADNQGTAEKIIEKYEQKGMKDSCVLAISGSNFKKENNRHYYLSLEEESDFEKLFESLKNDWSEFDCVINLMLYNYYSCNKNENDYESTLSKGILSFTKFFKQYNNYYNKNSLKYYLVTGGQQYIESNRTALLDSVSRMTFSFIKSAEYESPGFEAFSVDLHLGNSDRMEEAEIIFNEIFSAFPDKKVMYKEKKRFVQQLKHEKMELATEPSQELLSDGKYLVSGGLGGISQLLSDYLLSNFDISLVLLGRRQYSELTDPEIKFLNMCNQKYGDRVTYVKVDITNQAELCKEVKKISKKSTSPIKGIFHLAGISNEKQIVDESEESIISILKPKTEGTVNLIKLARELKLEKFIGFSSAFEYFGINGMAAYTAANSFLTEYINSNNDSNLKCYCLNWTTWKNIGLANKKNKELADMDGYFITKSDNSVVFQSFKDLGYETLKPSQALEAFLLCLAANVHNIYIGLDAKNKDIQKNIYAESFPKFKLDIHYQLKDNISELTKESMELMVKDEFNVKIPFSIAEEKSIPVNIKGHVDRNLVGKNRKRLTTGMKSEKVFNTIKEIWKSVLEVPEINSDDSFFDLGGNSIKLTRVQSKIKDAFDFDINMTDLFSYQTLIELSGFVSTFRKSKTAENGKSYTDYMEKLSKIWKSVLEVSEIKRDDSFFDLGGNSIKLTRVQSKIKDEFDLEIDISKLFQFVSIDELSEFIYESHMN